MIHVLLCTYNGERYLPAQLNSLLEQTGVEFQILIRDDGSSDKTPEILREYQTRHPDKVRIVPGRKHLGYPDCFWALLRESPKADAYAFCDQDDIWDREKLSHAQAALKEVPAGIPALWIHDYNVCDSSLRKKSVHTCPDLMALPPEKLLFYNQAEGFSMVLNEALRQILLGKSPEGKNLPHDELSLWTCAFHGRILQDHKILASYRRHEDTVTSTGSGTAGMIRSYLSKEISGPAFEEKCTRIALFADTDSAISPEERKTFLLLSGKSNATLLRLRRLFYPHRLKPTIGGETALRVLFLLH